MSLVAKFDRYQRDHPVVGFPLAVVYKFFDDQSNYLAATVTYYAFVAIFPILLIGSSVLGFFLQDDPELRDQILDTAVASLPIINTQIASTEGLHGSSWAVVAGALTALYGILGLGQSAQNAINVAWAVPRNSRPNPFLGRGRSLVMFGIAGLVLVSIAGVTAFLSGSSELIADGTFTWIDLLVRTGVVIVSGLAFTVLFRYASARSHSFQAAAPGAFAVAVMWQFLQIGGAAYVQHVIGRASNLNQVFAVVLGMLGLIYIGAVMGLFGVQINVVLTKRLYPRALLTPFTDNVRLTRADRRAYADYAKAQRHKGFEAIRVVFSADQVAPDAVEVSPEHPASVRPRRTGEKEQPEPQGS